MRTTNYSNEHARARVYGWNGGNTASGGSGTITVELLDASGAVTGVAILRVANLTDNGGGDVSLLPLITGGGGGNLDFSAGFPRLMDAFSGSEASRIGAATSFAFMLTHHTPGDLADTGVNFEAGDDEVGITLSEKDASTVQIYPDVAGGYDVEFVERTAGHFRFVISGGAAQAVPALGMLPQYAAAPHAGTETTGESYFDTMTTKAYTWDGAAWQAWW